MAKTLKRFRGFHACNETPWETIKRVKKERKKEKKALDKSKSTFKPETEPPTPGAVLVARKKTEQKHKESHIQFWKAVYIESISDTIPSRTRADTALRELRELEDSIWNADNTSD